MFLLTDGVPWCGYVLQFVRVSSSCVFSLPAIKASRRSHCKTLNTSSDPSVDVKGSYRYAARLSELGAPVEMHIYPVGGHGLGLANGLYERAVEPYVQRWIEDLERWLKLIGWIK